MSDVVDICPSCMAVLNASAFRNAFMPKAHPELRQPVFCDFSRPWVRYAWSQAIKRDAPNLDLVYNVLEITNTRTPCPGKKFQERDWYRLPDIRTGENVPNLHACSECVKVVREIFPGVGDSFTRHGRQQQVRTCDLDPESRRSDSYMAKLEEAHLDSLHYRKPNLIPFIDHFKKTSRYSECQGGDQLKGRTWHYDAKLPQFTVCEECYEHVVWPLRDEPVAKDICRRPRPLLPDPMASVSCQLYSERMRKVFGEVVRCGDFGTLREVALARWRDERELQERHARLVREAEAGWNRAAELEAVEKEWSRLK